MISNLAEVFRKYAGWCPMAAAAQQNKKSNTPVVPVERSMDPGPVERRAVLFFRLTFAVAVLAWIVAIAALPHLPQTVPVHWNMYGEADGFAERTWGAFGLPAIITATFVLLLVLPRFDRMRGSFEDSRDIYAIIIFASVCLLFAVEVAALLISAGMDLPMGMVFPVLIGFFFIVLGGLMPHLRRNTTAGIRLPWTIRSEQVWDETHKHGGPVFALAGILMVLLSTIAGQTGTLLALAVLLCTVIYITVWSYRCAGSLRPEED